MEKSVSLGEPIEFLFLHTIFNWVIMMLEKLPLGSMSFLHSHFRFCTCLSMVHDEQPMHKTSSQPRGDKNLSREEVEMVLDKMGLCCRHEDEYMGSEEISGLFEENEPSLEEVKAAFRVFDENNDGFIDAVELQTVLLKLGFTEGLEMDACRRMITIYDENGDGRIGFTEFVKLMEINLC